MTSINSIIATEDQSLLRLDKLLALHFPEHSRTYFQYLIDQGCILVNGLPLKKRDKPKPGDEIEVCFLLTPELKVEPEAIPLEILYEDEFLLAVNKPAGMVVHPAPGISSGTFANALLYHCKTLQPEKDDLRPGIVHRLDKDTTGLLLAAKTAEAHHKLVSLFAERSVEKHYLAITVGNPGEGWIDAPIGRHPVNRTQMTIRPDGGKEAKSHCTILAKTEQLSLVKVRIITGRTHQIRVHLKHRNAPVLGDQTYGSDKANKSYHVNRQMLHAYQISFSHPMTGKIIHLQAEPPADFLAIQKNI